ncbi:ricin-type beta-trefoil lectin domain protein [Streptomyces sp. NPDC057433]|uniref:ricin-type beta-trefoil lectin domain protein n=1 Tax=Streptomyces sp. NPDC057433 TaxID=3346132 RepID=UPI0036C12974
MSRQNRPGGGASARPAGTDGGPSVRRAVVLPLVGADAERAVLPAPRRSTAATGVTAVTAEDTGRADETGRGKAETPSTATDTDTAESGAVSAAHEPEERKAAASEPEERETAADPGEVRRERPETGADIATQVPTASPGAAGGSQSGLAAVLGGVRRSGGARRGSGDGDSDGAPGRPKAPVLAAAGIAGVILMAVPLLVMAGNDWDEEPEDHATVAAGSQALHDGEEVQPPPHVYAAEPPKDDGSAGSSKDGDGDEGKHGKAAEHGTEAEDGKQAKDDGKTPPDDSDPADGAGPRAASPKEKREEEKAEDAAEEPARRTGTKTDRTVSVATARIVNGDTGKCLTASSRGAGAHLVIQPCGASQGTQIWSFHDDDRTLRIGEDLCMGLDGGSVQEGTAILLQRCDGSDGQKFKINGTEDLVSLKAGDKCADVWWGKEANGTPVKLWPCTGTANQTWRRS